MKKPTKKQVLIGLAALSALTLTFTIGIGIYLNSDSFKSTVEEVASKELEMDVAIGTLDISLFGSALVKDIRIADAEGDEAITLEKVEGNISVLGILVGDVFPQDATIEGLSINLLKRGDKWNIPVLNAPPILLDKKGNPILDEDENPVRMKMEAYNKKLAAEKAKGKAKVVKFAGPQFLKLKNLNFKLTRQDAKEVTYNYTVTIEGVSMDLLGDVKNISSNGVAVYADTTSLKVEKWIAYGFEGTMKGSSEIRIDMTKEKPEPEYITSTMELIDISIEELTKNIPESISIQHEQTDNVSNLLKLGKMAAEYKNEKGGKKMDPKAAASGLFNGTISASYKDGTPYAKADLQTHKLQVSHPVLTSILGLLDKPSEFMVFNTSIIKFKLDDTLLTLEQFELSNPKYASLVSPGGEIELSYEQPSNSTVMIPIRLSMPSKCLKIKELRREDSDMTPLDFQVFGTFGKLEHTLFDAVWDPMENKLDAKIVQWMNKQKGIVIPDSVRQQLLKIAKGTFMATPSLNVNELFSKSLGELPSLLENSGKAIVRGTLEDRLQKELDKKLGQGKNGIDAGKILGILDGALNSGDSEKDPKKKNNKKADKSKSGLDIKGVFDIYNDVTDKKKVVPEEEDNTEAPQKEETDRERKKREKREKREGQIKGVLNLFK